MKHSALLITGLCLCATIVACSSKKGSNEGDNMATDSVRTDRTLIELSYQLPDDPKKKCEVKLSLDYPIAYQSESDLARLNSLLASQIFGPEYSRYTSLKEAADSAAQSTLNEMKEGLTTLCNEIELTSEITFTSLTQIMPVYNNGNFLSYNSSSYSYEGGAHGINNSFYYVIYLPTMSRITLSDIIAPEYTDSVHQMLINTLVKNLDLKNSKALIDVGYFDPENITATENFYINDKGVTWVYNPYEIGCYALGETSITLSYNDISYFIPENSPISCMLNIQTK